MRRSGAMRTRRDTADAFCRRTTDVYVVPGCTLRNSSADGKATIPAAKDKEVVAFLRRDQLLLSPPSRFAAVCKIDDAA